MCSSEMLRKPDEMLGGGGPCEGLASHPVGNSNTPCRSMLHRNRDKLPLDGTLIHKDIFGSCETFGFSTRRCNVLHTI